VQERAGIAGSPPGTVRFAATRATACSWWAVNLPISRRKWGTHPDDADFPSEIRRRRLAGGRQRYQLNFADEAITTRRRAVCAVAMNPAALKVSLRIAARGDRDRQPGRVTPANLARRVCNKSARGWDTAGLPVDPDRDDAIERGATLRRAFGRERGRCRNFSPWGWCCGCMTGCNR